jgi:hypothetical protein
MVKSEVAFLCPPTDVNELLKLFYMFYHIFTTLLYCFIPKCALTMQVSPAAAVGIDDRISNIDRPGGFVGKGT